MTSCDTLAYLRDKKLQGENIKPIRNRFLLYQFKRQSIYTTEEFFSMHEKNAFNNKTPYRLIFSLTEKLI